MKDGNFVFVNQALNAFEVVYEDACKVSDNKTKKGILRQMKILFDIMIKNYAFINRTPNMVKKMKKEIDNGNT